MDDEKKDALDHVEAKPDRGLLGDTPPGSLDELEARERHHAQSKSNADQPPEVDKHDEPRETHNPRTVEGFEARRASGFDKKGGRYVAADGLVSRRGNRRIAPNDTDDNWLKNIRPEQLAELEDAASKVLSGRNATVFERLVLEPLRDETRYIRDKLIRKSLGEGQGHNRKDDTARTVKSLAFQFGVNEARIYRIKNDCVAKIKKRLAAIADGGSVDGRPPRFTEAVLLEAWQCTDKCSVCGLAYVWSVQPECNGIYGEGSSPECLETQARSMQFAKSLAEAQEKDRRWDELHGATYYAQQRAKEMARLRADQAEVEAIRLRRKII